MKACYLKDRGTGRTEYVFFNTYGQLSMIIKKFNNNGIHNFYMDCEFLPNESDIKAFNLLKARYSDFGVSDIGILLYMSGFFENKKKMLEYYN